MTKETKVADLTNYLQSTKTGLPAVKLVIESFEYHTQDIENVLCKRWLKLAIVCHVVRDTELPKSFVSQLIDLIYLSDNV